MGTRVIVGVSGSLSNLAALHRAVEEARQRDALLVPVLAWAPPGGDAYYRQSPCPPLLERSRQAAHRRLDGAFDQAFGGYPDDLRIRPIVVRGETGPVLVDTADHPDDLLIIGTGKRRTGPWQRLLGGSGAVARYCLAHAGCPVTAVPPSELLDSLHRLHRIGDPLELLARTA